MNTAANDKTMSLMLSLLCVIPVFTWLYKIQTSVKT